MSQSNSGSDSDARPAGASRAASAAGAPLVVVISGPSGVGKDAVIVRMRELQLPFHFVVTVTTRPPRQCEVPGKDYRFVSRAEFKELLQRDALLEWAEVYGHYYGVPRDQVRAALQRGQDVVIKADVQGAATIKRLAPEAVTIFLAPPCIEELARRLADRKTESQEAFARRLATAEEEMKRRGEFDYVVVNRAGQLDETVQAVVAIIDAERRRPHRQPVEV